MRLLVVKAFIDKHTKIPYNAGYYYESDDLNRIKELQELGYLEKIPLQIEGDKQDEREEAVPTKLNKTSKRRKV
jgi:hypothetical protein